MYKDLKELFGTEEPSVRKFKQKLSVLSPEEQHAWHTSAYHAAFCDWPKLGIRYRTFLRNLVQHDWQRAADYLQSETVMGSLGYPLQEPDLLLRLLALLEGRKRHYMPSYLHMAFALVLAFRLPYKVSYLGELLRTRRMDSDHLMDLFGRVRLNNIDEE